MASYRCKFRFNNGRQCTFHVAEAKRLCWIHDPSKLPIFFIESVEGHFKGQEVTDLPIDVAQQYIDTGVAVEIDYKLQQRLDKNFLSYIAKRHKKTLKEKAWIVLYIKKLLADRDEALTVMYFNQGSSPDSILKLITSRDFTKDERDYMQFIVSKYDLLKDVSNDENHDELINHKKVMKLLVDEAVEDRLKDFYSGKVEGYSDDKPKYTIRILILEDDTSVLSVLTKAMSELEKEIVYFGIALTILSESSQVEEYINQTKIEFDIILLDRDCKSCSSFHVLDFEKFGTDKIIAISAIPEWNEEAKERGVNRIILKNTDHLEEFARKVILEIKKMIQ